MLVEKLPAESLSSRIGKARPLDCFQSSLSTPGTALRGGSWWQAYIVLVALLSTGSELTSKDAILNRDSSRVTLITPAEYCFSQYCVMYVLNGSFRRANARPPRRRRRKLCVPSLARARTRADRTRRDRSQYAHQCESATLRRRSARWFARRTALITLTPLRAAGSTSCEKSEDQSR